MTGACPCLQEVKGHFYTLPFITWYWQMFYLTQSLRSETTFSKWTSASWRRQTCKKASWRICGCFRRQYCSVRATTCAREPGQKQILRSAILHLPWGNIRMLVAVFIWPLLELLKQSIVLVLQEDLVENLWDDIQAQSRWCRLTVMDFLITRIFLFLSKLIDFTSTSNLSICPWSIRATRRGFSSSYK